MNTIWLIGLVICIFLVFQNCTKVSNTGGENLSSLSTVSPSPTPGPAPEFIFSLSADGSNPISPLQWPLNQTVYAFVKGFDDTSIYSCAVAEEEAMTCESHLVAMPNADWSYSGGVWKAQLKFGNDVAGKKFFSIWTDTQTNRKIGVHVQFQNAPVPTCNWTAFVVGPSNPTPPSSPCTQVNEGAAYDDGTYNWMCQCTP